MNKFINPEWIWENWDRKTKGCFACAHSKRGEIDGRVQSYCQPEKDGLIAVDYPHEDKSTCKLFWRRKRTVEDWKK